MSAVLGAGWCGEARGQDTSGGLSAVAGEREWKQCGGDGLGFGYIWKGELMGSLDGLIVGWRERGS